MAAPKVIIREVQSGPSTVIGVGTAVAGFIGLADKGPIGEAKLITSFAQYEEMFGGFRSDSFLSHAVLGFFQNGGSACYIVRTAHYSNVSNGDLDPTANLKASTTLVDRSSPSLSTLKIDALSHGDHGNSISIDISRASNEPASFNKVFGCDGGVYTDNSTAARTAALYKTLSDHLGVFTDNTTAANTAGGGTAFFCFNSTPSVDDALYVGAKEKTFNKVYFDINIAATVAGVAQLEYWNGSSWQVLTPVTDQITSGGITFGATAADNKLVEFNAPADWRRVEVNSTLAYWVRWRVSSAYTGASPKIDRISLSEDKPFGAFTIVASSSVETAAATALNDIMYLGSTVQFKYAELGLLTAGGGTGTVAWEYWNGQNWSSLSNITETVTNAKNLRASGIVGWDMPSNWQKCSVNSSSSMYFVRARITVNYSTTYPALDHALPASDLFKISVKSSGTLVETWDNVQLSDSAAVDYVEAMVGSPSAPVSNYITCSVQANADPKPNNRPIEVVDAKLTGGLYVTSSVSDLDYIGSSSSKCGLYALPDEATMVLVPGVMTEAVYNAMLSYAEDRQDCMAILEAPGDVATDSPQELVDFVRDEAALNSSYGAIYDYWIITSDPITGARLSTPPSGHIAGMYSRVDESRGVWKAPAGIQDGRLFGALGVVYKTDQAERDLMYDNKINPIRDQAGVGVHVDGSITLAPLGTDFDRVSIRRLFMYVEESLQDAFQVFKHEPIDTRLFDRMRSTAQSFLLDIWRKGGLRGDKPSDAFFVTCDESNNPPSSTARRQVNVKIGLAALQPAEFIILEFSLDKRALNAELVSAGLQ